MPMPNPSRGDVTSRGGDKGTPAPYSREDDEVTKLELMHRIADIRTEMREHGRFYTLVVKYDVMYELLKAYDALDAANARITELEAQLAKPATIHEVIDDFGESVTAVTL